GALQEGGPEPERAAEDVGAVPRRLRGAEEGRDRPDLRRLQGGLLRGVVGGRALDAADVEGTAGQELREAELGEPGRGEGLVTGARPLQEGLYDAELRGAAALPRHGEQLRRGQGGDDPRALGQQRQLLRVSQGQGEPVPRRLPAAARARRE